MGPGLGRLVGEGHGALCGFLALRALTDVAPGLGTPIVLCPRACGWVRALT